MTSTITLKATTVLNTEIFSETAACFSRLLYADDTAHNLNTRNIFDFIVLQEELLIVYILPPVKPSCHFHIYFKYTLAEKRPE